MAYEGFDDWHGFIASDKTPAVQEYEYWHRTCRLFIRFKYIEPIAFVGAVFLILSLLTA